MSIKQHDTGLTKANNFVWGTGSRRNVWPKAVGVPYCKGQEERTLPCSPLDPWCLEEGLENSRLNKYLLLAEPKNRDACIWIPPCR